MNGATGSPTTAAHRQAVELAHELAAILGADRPRPALRALAYWVAQAHADEKEIGSLAFIGENLARRCDTGDDGWIYDDLPYRMPRSDVAPADPLAREAIPLLEKAGHSVDRRALLSAPEIETLAILLGRYQRPLVAAGINKVLNSSKKYHFDAWSYFETDIVAANREAVEQPRRMMTDTEMRAEWARQRAVAAEKLAAMREIAAAGVEQLRAGGIEADEHRLLITSEVNNLTSRLHRVADQRQVLTAVIERFLAAPHRRDVKAWSNLHKAFDAVLAETAKASA